MIASSTTMPTVRVRPSTVNVFSVKPKKYITMKVPRIEVGMASSTFRVVDQEPRNTQQTSPVSRAARSRVKRISSMACLTKIVLSKLTPRDMPSGRSRCDLLELRPHAVAHLHRVRAAQLADAEADGRLALGAGEAAPVLEAVLHHRHVLQADRRALAVGHHELAEGLDVDRLALRADVHLPLRRLDAAGGHLQVLACDGLDDVEDGEALGLEPRWRRTRRGSSARGSRR